MKRCATEQGSSAATGTAQGLALRTAYTDEQGNPYDSGFGLTY